MTRVATSRLMEATASLPLADRALVNLWVNRGLDDAAVAGLIGMSEEAIASRRARIVEHLSATLGLPPDDVHAALNEIRVASSSGNGAAERAAAVDETTVAEPAAAGDETTAAATTAELEAVPAPRRRGRARWWGWGLAVVTIAAACILVVSLASSGSRHRRRPPVARASTQTAPTSPGGSATSRSGAEPLTALPGATGHASGSVAISHGLTLSLRVSKLPPASNGHYEIWLYDSVTNSVPLGRLRTGVDQLSLPVPSDAGRYRWIDISFQPVGAVFHSGESLLRAADPLFGR
jgi:Anti-sigma-K factor rskA